MLRQFAQPARDRACELVRSRCHSQLRARRGLVLELPNKRIHGRASSRTSAASSPRPTCAWTRRTSSRQLARPLGGIVTTPWVATALGVRTPSRYGPSNSGLQRRAGRGIPASETESACSSSDGFVIPTVRGRDAELTVRGRHLDRLLSVSIRSSRGPASRPRRAVRPSRSDRRGRRGRGDASRQTEGHASEIRAAGAPELEAGRSVRQRRQSPPSRWSPSPDGRLVAPEGRRFPSRCSGLSARTSTRHWACLR